MIRRLKAWLKRPENSTAKLAYLLGYKSGSTISNWISRNKIPEFVKPRLKEVLK